MNTYTDYSQRESAAAEQREGPIARSIERQTARMPSDAYLWAAGAALIASLALEVVGMTRRAGRRGIIRRSFQPATTTPLAGFVGLWVPSLLLLGVYNKIVKVAGSDRTEQRW